MTKRMMRSEDKRFRTDIVVLKTPIVFGTKKVAMNVEEIIVMHSAEVLCIEDDA